VFRTAAFLMGRVRQDAITGTGCDLDGCRYETTVDGETVAKAHRACVVQEGEAIVRRAYRLWSLLDLLACLIVGCMALYLACIAATREDTLAGQGFVFLAMAALASLACVTTRYHVLCGLIFIVMIGSLDQIDKVKFAATHARLHVSDWLVAANFVRDLDVSIVSQYARQLRAAYWAVGVLIIAAPILWLCERAALRKVRVWCPPTGTFAAALVSTGVCFTALAHSQYVQALAGFHPVDLHWTPNGLRLSSVVVQVSQIAKIDSEIKALQAQAGDAGVLPPSPSAAGARCGDAGCPDIVIVHLESVFDPILLADYHATGGYVGQMEKQSLAASESGLLRVHTWGGASWLSEFAVLCGVNPSAFGLAGALPHINLAPYVANCLPNHLRRLGYETHAVYTSNWNFAGAGPGFKQYGIDDFIDIRRVKNAPVDWLAQRDRFFVAEARRILNEPSAHPRFIFVSTNWNHSPHGQGRHPVDYPGPFDPGTAKDAATRDYINRLNDTFTEMAALERDLMAREKPAVLLLYGDHHPSFPKTYASDFVRDPHTVNDRLTLYRLARNYGRNVRAPHNTRWIEELPIRLLEFADIPLGPAMERIRSLRETCNGADEQCPPAAKSGIAAAILAN